MTDPGGYAVPEVKVVLESNSTGFDRDMSTNYEFLAVPVADSNNITVEATGFEKSVQSGFRNTRLGRDERPMKWRLTIKKYRV